MADEARRGRLEAAARLYENAAIELEGAAHAWAALGEHRLRA